MAARGAAAAVAACVWRQRRNASLLSVSRFNLNLNLQHSLSSREIAWRTRQVRAIQGTTADRPSAPVKKEEEVTPQNWKIKMLYDGDCPLCMREVNMLMERNKQYGTIKFVDISSDNYSPEENQGLDYETVSGVRTVFHL